MTDPFGSQEATYQLSRLCLLQKAQTAQVCWDPFPHLVIENALDAEVYAELATAFPPDEVVRSATHVANRDQLMARDILADPFMPDVWKDFVTRHISQTFYRQLAVLFEPYVRQLYPWLEEEKGRGLLEFTCGVRDRNAAELPDVCLDCQPGLNVVSHEPMSYRTAHLDANNKLFTGLFYMRMDGDDSEGGDLVLYKARKNPLTFDTPTTIPEDDLEAVKTVHYRANTVLFFMNSPVSFHGVSVRSGTTIPRRLVNLIAGLYTLRSKGLFPSPPAPDVINSTRFTAP